MRHETPSDSLEMRSWDLVTRRNAYAVSMAENSVYDCSSSPPTSFVLLRLCSRDVFHGSASPQRFSFILSSRPHHTLGAPPRMWSMHCGYATGITIDALRSVLLGRSWDEVFCFEWARTTLFRGGALAIFVMV